MAKKSNAANALEGPTTLERGVDEYIGIHTGGKFPGYKGWTTSASGGVLMHESYFDLGGYEREYLTIFPTNAALQDNGYYTTTVADATTNLVVLDIISQERLNINDVENDWQTFRNVPSNPTSTEDFEQIIFGRFRFMAPTTSFTYGLALTPVSGGSFGSGSPSTAQKLWCYRFLIYDAVSLDGVKLEVNATRFLMAATIVKEDDLPFMMRQKRSYELSSGP